MTNYSSYEPDVFYPEEFSEEELSETYDFVADTFDLQYLGELYEEGTKCNACYGTGLDRYEDVDCLKCMGDGYV